MVGLGESFVTLGRAFETYSAFTHVNAQDTAKFVQALTAAMKAAGCCTNCNMHLSSLVQSQHDIEISMKVPAAAVDEFKAAGITDVLVSLKDKAEGADGNAKHDRAIAKVAGARFAS